MLSLLERVTIFCFAASYGVALLLELGHLFRPRPIWRMAALAFGGAGLLAHAIYVTFQPLSLVTPTGSLLFLALILAVFYLYGSIHHHRLAWGLFVLPIVLALIGLAVVRTPSAPHEAQEAWAAFWDRFWPWAHGILLLLAAVGISVAFIASVMYLVQVERLRAKLPPSRGMRLLSLERLEEMNRRAILTAFPLLTAGLLVGLALQVQHGTLTQGWDSVKLVSTFVLWGVFAILLYLRYAAHVRGRQVALLTMLAFVLLIVALVAPEHAFVHGGGP